MLTTDDARKRAMQISGLLLKIDDEGQRKAVLESVALLMGFRLTKATDG